MTTDKLIQPGKTSLKCSDETRKGFISLSNSGGLRLKMDIFFHIVVNMMDEARCVLELEITKQTNHKGRVVTKRPFEDVLNYRDIPACDISLQSMLKEIHDISESLSWIEDTVSLIVNEHGILTANTTVPLNSDDHVKFCFTLNRRSTHVEFEMCELCKVFETDSHSLCRCHATLD